ncbi:MAG: transcriptional regulator [Chitinophagaceae bacterium]|nr:MAG: transcriptional regulator [Chitinophagaceae bacterium]
MAKVKENSTRSINKLAQLQCPVTYVMDRIGGHWKPIILYQLMEGPKRYSELKRAIPSITEKVLIQHLKQLQEDELVIRKAKNVVPPFVEYSLGSSGLTMKPLLHQMALWAVTDNQQRRGRKKVVPKQPEAA